MVRTACIYLSTEPVWRHVQKIGLQERYINDPDFAVGVRQLLALAFVPTDDISKAFSELCLSEFWNEDRGDVDTDKLQDLIHYFERTYIGVETRNKLKRRAVTFPPTLWGVYEITKLGMEVFSSLLYF